MGSAASKDGHPQHHQMGHVPRLAQRADQPQGDGGIRLAHVQRRSPARPPARGRLPLAAPRRRARRVDRPERRRHHRQRAEGLGRRARRDALHPLVPAAHRHHRREARLVSRRRRPTAAPSPSSAARNWSRRARRVELPVRRHALDLRSARLHGVGSDQPALAADDRRTAPRSSSRPRS